jgi:sugar phosphate isomerase/epimerase
MKIGMLTVMFNDKPLEEVARYASALGYEMFELAVQRGAGHFDLDEASNDPLYAPAIKRMLASYGIEISALADHVSGQMVLPPPDSSLDQWAGTSDKEEMWRYGKRHVLMTARVASAMEIPVVTCFTGSTVWGSWYMWPPQHLELYERGWDLFAERWMPILDEFSRLGVRLAHEVHPTEIAYNIHTAQLAIEKLGGHPAFGFNFDPSHLVWQMIDPVVFIKRFGSRILHAHAKDAELQQDVLHVDGVLSTGSWRRPDRAFRYRVPGWGDINWKRIVTALVEVGYDYVLSFEHEDPVMSERDGAEKAIDFLRPLLFRERFDPSANWWAV